MLDEKIILGAVALGIGIISYTFYFRDFLRGKTKPDSASWFIWGLLAAITFFAQFSRGGGAGAWITAFTALACLTIAGLSFYRGHRELKRIDMVSLVGVVIGIALWAYTDDPLIAVICALGIGAMGFVPVFLKVLRKPQEETMITYGLNASKFAVALFALQSFTPVTWLYPAGMAAMNTLLVSIIIFRMIGRHPDQ